MPSGRAAVDLDMGTPRIGDERERDTTLFILGVRPIDLNAVGFKYFDADPSRRSRSKSSTRRLVGDHRTVGLGRPQRGTRNVHYHFSTKGGNFPGRARVRGGAGRTRANNQTVME